MRRSGRVKALLAKAATPNRHHRQVLEDTDKRHEQKFRNLDTEGGDFRSISLKTRLLSSRSSNLTGLDSGLRDHH